MKLKNKNNNRERDYSTPFTVTISMSYKFNCTNFLVIEFKKMKIIIEKEITHHLQLQPQWITKKNCVIKLGGEVKAKGHGHLAPMLHGINVLSIWWDLFFSYPICIFIAY